VIFTPLANIWSLFIDHVHFLYFFPVRFYKHFKLCVILFLYSCSHFSQNCPFKNSLHECTTYSFNNILPIPSFYCIYRAELVMYCTCTCTCTCTDNILSFLSLPTSSAWILAGWGLGETGGRSGGGELAALNGDASYPNTKWSCPSFYCKETNFLLQSYSNLNHSDLFFLSKEQSLSYHLNLQSRFFPALFRFYPLWGGGGRWESGWHGPPSSLPLSPARDMGPETAHI
jgi:hypothetical protein